MLLMFGVLSLAALASTLALWMRERGPHAQGLRDLPPRAGLRAVLTAAAAANTP